MLTDSGRCAELVSPSGRRFIPWHHLHPEFFGGIGDQTKFRFIAAQIGPVRHCLERHGVNVMRLKSNQHFLFGGRGEGAAADAGARFQDNCFARGLDIGKPHHSGSVVAPGALFLITVDSGTPLRVSALFGMPKQGVPSTWASTALPTLAEAVHAVDASASAKPVNNRQGNV